MGVGSLTTVPDVGASGVWAWDRLDDKERRLVGFVPMGTMALVLATSDVGWILVHTVAGTGWVLLEAPSS